jgi:hypothetical protein
VTRVDLVARGAFGGLCVAGMCGLAVPLLLIVGPTGAIINLIEGDQWRAFWVWVGSWLGMAVAGGMFLLTAYISWPLASDWITEWQGYALAFVIGACGLVAMILTVFLTTWPLAVELIVPLAGTFIVGCVLPGRLLGLGRTSALPMERRRHDERKRTRNRAGTR